MINEGWAVFWAGLYVLRNTRARDLIDHVCVFAAGWCFLISRNPSHEVVNSYLFALGAMCSTGPVMLSLFRAWEWLRGRLEQ